MIHVKVKSISQWLFILLPLSLLAQGTEPDKNMKFQSSDLEVVSTSVVSYPRKAVLEGIEGHVVLQFDTDINGRAQNVKIIESVPARIFDKVALKAIYQWVFKPANRKDLFYTMVYKLEQ